MFNLSRQKAAAYVVAALLLVNLGATAMPAFAEGRGIAVRVVAYGDSLTAGYGLTDSAAFPAQLEKALKAKGYDVTVANAGVSGDTTASGLERFEWAVPEGTDAVVLELGGNDALRGLDPKQARRNLEAIVERLKARGVTVLLAGMMAPRSLGADYVAAFDRIYPELAEKHGLVYYPFFLDGVAQNGALNLDDGLHPNSRGVSVIVERILPKVEEMIARARARGTQSKLQP